MMGTRIKSYPRISYVYLIDYLGVDIKVDKITAPDYLQGCKHNYSALLSVCTPGCHQKPASTLADFDLRGVDYRVISHVSSAEVFKHFLGNYIEVNEVDKEAYEIILEKATQLAKEPDALGKLELIKQVALLGDREGFSEWVINILGSNESENKSKNTYSERSTHSWLSSEISASEYSWEKYDD